MMDAHKAIRDILDSPRSLIVAEEMRTRTYGAGRVCGHEGCRTHLSRYNPGDYCCVHADDEYDPRTVAMDYTADGNRTCSRCGRQLAPNLKYFYSDTASKDGLSAECVACLNPERAARERGMERRGWHRRQEARRE